MEVILRKLRQKRTEKLLKQLLSTMPTRENKDVLITDDKRSLDVSLAEIGLSRKEKDTFYIEIKTENLV